MKLFSRRKKQEPSLKDLCDAVAAHPDTVMLAVFDRGDFEREGLDPSTLASVSDEVGADIYHLVMRHAEYGYGT